jgi:hypothetical protein
LHSSYKLYKSIATCLSTEALRYNTTNSQLQSVQRKHGEIFNKIKLKQMSLKKCNDIAFGKHGYFDTAKKTDRPGFEVDMFADQDCNDTHNNSLCAHELLIYQQQQQQQQ